MIEYLNPSGRIIILTGPKGERVEFKKFERKVLEPYYKRYVPRYIKVVKEFSAPPKIPVPSPSVAPKPIVTSRTVPRQPQPNLMAAAQERLRQAREREERRKHMAVVRNTAAAVRNNKGRGTSQVKRKIVGSTNMRGGVATQHYEEITQKLSFPVSNDIGVGILSYNRLDSLKRLVNSIRHHTNLKRTTVFISDESDNAAIKEYLNNIKDMVILQNKERLGVAGNTNRLMRCLARFNFKIILNDDVEVLNSGWENVYTNAMLGTGIHHFCFRQPGIYGAKPNDERIQQINNFKVKTITEKPHGAVIAYDDLAFKKVGFLDERFGLYGMEHVDWSHRVQMAGIQPTGYHDILGSDHFFKIHNDKSAVEHRTEHLSSSRGIYEQVKKDKNRIYVEPSTKSNVPGVTYIVPFRGLDRSNAIRVVALNLKAQAYPVIEIIMVEQDEKQTQGNLSPFKSIKYVLAKNWVVGQAFTKALACNVGVANATQDKLIIHDADMVVERDYTARMAELLDNYNAVHIGKNVIYLSKPACEKIYKTCSFTPDLSVERTVGYYEGGSLGCRYNVYVNIGGFDERFIGYGCFCPGNYVLTRDGYKVIEDIRECDKLYTHEGRFKSIELRSRYFNGEVLDIYVPGRLPIKGVTSEHPFLVRVDGDEWQWRKAEDLQKGDEILDTDFMPELVEPYDLQEIMRLDRSKNKFEIHDHMDNFCYLLGLYIAEGVLQSPDRLRTIYLFLNKDELFLAEHVEKIAKQLNDEINVTYEYVKNNCRDVRIFNSLLAKMIYAVAGKYHARNKVLSYQFLQGLSDSHIEFLLGGLCDGDANHSNGSRKRVIYHTSSINMAMIASGLMRRIDVAHSFGKRSGGSFEGSAEFGFDLCINREFEHKIRMLYPREPVIGSSAFGRSQFGKVYDIQNRAYEGLVYNFEVEDDHSYIVNGLVVHNCEDTEFFARLSSVERFYNTRSVDLIHLWHSRTAGWKNHHDRNKDIEKRAYTIPMAQRISTLFKTFKEKYNLTLH